MNKEDAGNRSYAVRPEGGPDEQARIADQHAARAVPNRSYTARPEGGPDEQARGQVKATVPKAVPAVDPIIEDPVDPAEQADQQQSNKLAISQLLNFQTETDSAESEEK